MQGETKIKPVFKCPEEYKTTFKNAKCLLTISVGQEVHEGEKFKTTIDLINNWFKECTILIDDTLQRHSMKLSSSLSIEELYLKSLEEGRKWLQRNNSILNTLKIPFNITYWDKWLSHKNYKNQYEKITKLYKQDINYKESFDIAIHDFLERYIPRLPKNIKINKKEAFSLCLEYLKEECTALCLWIEENAQFEVYPSKRNQAMSITHEIFVKPYYPGLLLPVAIKFKNRKQLKPQKLIIDI